MKSLLRLAFTLSLGILFFLPHVNAQDSSTNNPISLDSFTGVYHLSRDAQGLSLLTSEETILANFPGGSKFKGIDREIPSTYQGHSVEVKIQSVTDAAGNNIPYTTKNNKDDVLVTTGDQNITLYGSQTFKIKYQTIGVIDIGSGGDVFLLNVNGRGWEQGFNKVNATLYIPSSFGSSLKNDPSCYTTLGDTTDSNCLINTDKSASEEIVITSSAGPLVAHQALILKLEFAPSTFTNKRQSSSAKLFIAVSFGILITVILFIIVKRLVSKIA